MLLHIVASLAVVSAVLGSSSGRRQRVPESCAGGQTRQDEDLLLHTVTCDKEEGQWDKLWDPRDVPRAPGPATSLLLTVGRAATGESSQGSRTQLL